MRVRHITQDDAHIFCTRGADPRRGHRLPGLRLLPLRPVRLRAAPGALDAARRSAIGTDEMWDRAEAALQGALDARGLTYEINAGDGAFYGPKIDLHMTDSIGRSWQLGHRPARLLDARALRPALHRRRRRRAPAGDDPPRAAGLLRALHRHPHRALRRRVPALARAGAGDRAADRRPPRRRRRASVLDALRTAGLRAEVDERTESVGRKIRDAELRKIPYMLVVGDREAEDGTRRGARAPRAATAGSVPVARARRAARASRSRAPRSACTPAYTRRR